MDEVAKASVIARLRADVDVRLKGGFGTPWSRLVPGVSYRVLYSIAKRHAIMLPHHADKLGRPYLLERLNRHEDMPLRTLESILKEDAGVGESIPSYETLRKLLKHPSSNRHRQRSNQWLS